MQYVKLHLYPTASVSQESHLAEDIPFHMAIHRPLGLVCESICSPPLYPSPARPKTRGMYENRPPPTPAQASRLRGASKSLVDASGAVFSRQQRFSVPMMWFGTDFFAVLGCSRLDFWTFQRVGGMAEPFKLHILTL